MKGYLAVCYVHNRFIAICACNKLTSFQFFSVCCSIDLDEDFVCICIGTDLFTLHGDAMPKCISYHTNNPQKAKTLMYILVQLSVYLIRRWRRQYCEQKQPSAIQSKENVKRKHKKWEKHSTSTPRSISKKSEEVEKIYKWDF